MNKGQKILFATLSNYMSEEKLLKYLQQTGLTKTELESIKEERLELRENRITKTMKYLQAKGVK